MIPHSRLTNDTTLPNRSRMRNRSKRGWPLKLAAAMALSGILLGCGANAKALRRQAAATQTAPAAVLTEGYSALEAQQYNDAIAKADQFLSAQPHGPGSAEALYLKAAGWKG